jgi:hypothetical protein
MKERPVIKSSGDFEKFSRDKIYKSLHNCGANEQMISELLNDLDIDDESLSTEQVFNKAYRILKRESAEAAAKYKLKRAILQLGDSGYPFEQFVARLFQNLGYEVKVGEILQGRCIHHEVDVVAEKDNEISLIECKHHKRLNHKSGVQIPLYVQSRYTDIKEQWAFDSGRKDKDIHGWIVTNTFFSEDAKKYAKCIGLKLVDWSYPNRGSLKDRVEFSKLYPITSLSSFDKQDITKLLGHNIVVVQDFCDDSRRLIQCGVKKETVRKVMKEVELVCHLDSY